jgi:hypothetical protein
MSASRSLHSLWSIRLFHSYRAKYWAKKNCVETIESFSFFIKQNLFATLIAEQAVAEIATAYGQCYD